MNCVIGILNKVRQCAGGKVRLFQLQKSHGSGNKNIIFWKNTLVFHIWNHFVVWLNVFLESCSIFVIMMFQRKFIFFFLQTLSTSQCWDQRQRPQHELTWRGEGKGCWENNAFCCFMLATEKMTKKNNCLLYLLGQATSTSSILNICLCRKSKNIE